MDVTAKSTIAFSNRNGEEADHYTILETLGGGVGLFDYDRDGWLDIFLVGGGYFGPGPEVLGHPNRLYRNEGDGRFRDVTASVGLDRPIFYGQGCAVGDYDNDGWQDLLVTGYGRLALYRNVHGTFQEVSTAAGLLNKHHPHWSTSAAWGDFNRDGFLDLYVAHYVDWSFQNHPHCSALVAGQSRETCSPRMFGALPHDFYLSDGKGGFRDAREAAGIPIDPQKSGKGLGVIAADLNDDGHLDLFVTNDSTGNFLYLNRGDARFVEAGMLRGAGVGETGKPDGSMGVDAADYDGSGHLSLFVSNYEKEMHALYRNRGDARFQHSSVRTGIAALGLNLVGFGTGFLDYDLDGNEDLVLVCGHTVRHPAPPITLAQRAVLLRNQYQPGDRPSDVCFLDVSSQGGAYFQSLHRGRGLALGDLNNDGRTDLVVSHTNEPVALLENCLAQDQHWLGISLVGQPCPDAVGAKLVLEVGERRLVRAVKSGGSYLSSNDQRVIFGLGSCQHPGKLTVRWPSGRTQTWENLTPNRYWQLVEGETKPRKP